jgi:hypothetical protein
MHLTGRIIGETGIKEQKALKVLCPGVLEEISLP